MIRAAEMVRKSYGRDLTYKQWPLIEAYPSPEKSDVVA
jgi:hypothetical protein